MTAQRCTERDRGSAGVEAALAVTALLSVTWFTIGALRVSTSSGDVGAAARAGARAAAAVRAGSEVGAAESVVVAALADRGVACAGGPEVRVTRGAASVGGTVTVSVACAVQLSDVAAVFGSDQRTVRASATELVDVLRGGTP